MVCLNSHVWIAVKSLLKRRINIWLASFRSNNLTFDFSYESFTNRPLGNCEVFYL
jgi:hypothetical protein